ncbi:hypothetical protein VCRA2114E365_80195 [Vibrio crassostreae]|uniref:Uncharacterized protein n=3 Tax=Vibrio TaxID=662 RepID=A0ABM9R118_9VIBR|nr:hypothetical protein VCRA2117O37_310032 [Vibrio crassostreae]CAK2036479.1 hypothetical protein VCRA2119O45_330013 [Vibrio crassostreae]CAK2038621.1 hypothetical protein VCRA2116O31_370033 [Vibrio crassostreae]CAK2040247.1 hypothetical protein VCRA2118O41_320032 [Vibrio crassostreae]CAK2040625.1 hypothetical protein VCRA2113O22_320032 [Vibrio crassostreae]
MREGSQMGRFKGSRDNKPKGQPKPISQPKVRRPGRNVPSPPRERPAGYSTCATR